jgi:hypothetical protein
MGAFFYGYKTNSAAMYESVTNDEGEVRMLNQEVMELVLATGE